MAGPSGKLRLSVSSIKKYLKCPMSWYFLYVKKVPPKTDYPRLCGVLVHRFIAKLHKDVPKGRRFWYKSLDSARGAWFKTWEMALEENKGNIINPKADQADKYGAIGYMCIQNYWNTNFDRPDPICIEKTYIITWSPGVELMGVVDQLRFAKPNWMRKKRPDLFTEDTLLKGYSDNLIVDLKTGWGDYSLDDTTTDEEKVRKQISIQLDIQAPAYALLFKENNKQNWPFAFVLYQLQHSDENMYVVKGDLNGSQDVLRKSINHVVSNVRAGSFPPTAGYHCSYCDYVIECSKQSNMGVSNSNTMVDLLSSKETVPEPKPVQLKLDFKKKSNKTPD